MTVHALLVDPPREGLVLPELVETTPLTTHEAADLYAAMTKDAMRAAASSGGDLLVNYRPNDLLPETFRGPDVETELRALAASAVDDVETIRFEVQVGSSVEARAGNTTAHLLGEEDATSVAILRPTSPTVTRTALDSAAMKLRRSEVVLGPAPGGRVAYLGLTEAIDFDGAFAPPALSTIATRASAAGLSVDFVPMHPVVDTAADLVTLLSMLDARRAAGRLVPESTATVLDDLGLRVVADAGECRIDR